MTAREPGLLALADQVHAATVRMLDDLIAAVRRDMARHDAAGDVPGEAFDVAELSVRIRRAARREQACSGISPLSAMLALAVYRLATDERDGRPVETRHPTGGVL